MKSLRCIQGVAHLATALGISFHAVPAAAQLSTAEIARRATPATVVIVALNQRGDTIGSGSGFVVRADGVLITAYHVLAGASAAAVRLTTGEIFTRVEVVDADSTADVAVLKISGFGLPVLPVEAATPRVGANLVAIGSPRGLESTVSTGIVSAVRLFEGKQLIQMTAPISPGSSGGPVLNASGRVVAVAVSQIRDGQALNFAVPIRYPMGMIRADLAPRSVAEVFADAQVVDEGLGGTTGVRDWARFPTAAAIVKPEHLPDTYGYTGISTIIMNDRTWTREWLGFFVIAAENTGWMVHFLTDSLGELEQASVSVLLRAYVTSRGRILLSPSGRPSLLGYVTEEGGMAVAGDTTVLHEQQWTRWVDSLVAKPIEFPLNVDAGLLDLSWRSQWRSSRQARATGNHLDWRGTAAVVVQADTISVALVLENDSGGTTGITARGPITDGSFSLDDRGGSTLKGRIVGGQLSAEFIDVREDGSRFEGQLYGQRR